MSQESCPSRENLRRLLHGELCEKEAMSLERHFAACSSCGRLAAALEATGEWDKAQKSLSLDLRGVWPELRVGDSLFPPTVTKDTLAATAAREVRAA